jgi:hypothetical protein
MLIILYLLVLVPAYIGSKMLLPEMIKPVIAKG